MPKSLTKAILQIFIIVYGYSILFQIIIVGGYLSGSTNPSFSQYKPFLDLVFLQTENILVALIAALLLRLFYKTQKWRIVYFTIIVLLLFHQFINLIFYSFFFEHWSFNVYQESDLSMTRMMDSTIAGLNSVHLLSLIGLGIAIYLVMKITIKSPTFNKDISFHRIYSKKINVIIGGAVIMLFFVGMFFNKMENNLGNNPLLVVIKSTVNKDDYAAKLLEKELTPGLDLFTLQHGVTNNNSPEHTKVRLNELANFNSPPNVIHIIVESVGAINLFPNGNLDPKITPNLNALKDYGVGFTKIYNTFPGSERSHIAISTGGNVITFGNLKSHSDYKYVGPTLVGNLKKAGYKTGLFSAMFMDTENFHAIYDNLPYDYKLIPEYATLKYIQKHRLNDWGIDEKEVFEQAENWIRKGKNKQPFFAQILSMGTHHPYSTPDGYTPTFGSHDKGRHKTAIHYLDRFIGELYKFLELENLLENTVIVINGDHGQAFGERHSGNFLHKNHLYEENIRNFFLIYDFRKKNGWKLINRTGGIGDIMPTILNITNNTAQKIPGQSLLDSNYETRIQFFHKNFHPEKWGLLDGDWKFITRKNGNKFPELYNLSVDQLEQNNLASEYPDRISNYHKLCANWYVQANQNFMKNVAEYSSAGNLELTAEQVTSSGPKILKFGYIDQENEFVERSTAPANEPMFAYTVGVAYLENTTLIYELIDPFGQSTYSAFTYDKEWTTTWHNLPIENPVATGEYTVKIHDQNKLILNGKFTISEN